MLSPDIEEFCLYTTFVCPSRPLANWEVGGLGAPVIRITTPSAVADGRPKSAPVVHGSRYLYVLSVYVIDNVIITMYLCGMFACVYVSLSSCRAGDLLFSLLNDRPKLVPDTRWFHYVFVTSVNDHLLAAFFYYPCGFFR